MALIIKEAEKPGHLEGFVSLLGRATETGVTHQQLVPSSELCFIRFLRTVPRFSLHVSLPTSLPTFLSSLHWYVWSVSQEPAPVLCRDAEHHKQTLMPVLRQCSYLSCGYWQEGWHNLDSGFIPELGELGEVVHGDNEHGHTLRGDV